jgi:hypothetical protein
MAKIHLGGLEYGFQIFHALRRLCFYIAFHKLSSGRIQGNLARDIEGAVGQNGLVIGTNGGRCIGRVYDFFIGMDKWSIGFVTHVKIMRKRPRWQAYLGKEGQVEIQTQIQVQIQTQIQAQTQVQTNNQ